MEVMHPSHLDNCHDAFDSFDGFNQSFDDTFHQQQQDFGLLKQHQQQQHVQPQKQHNVILQAEIVSDDPFAQMYPTDSFMQDPKLHGLSSLTSIQAKNQSETAPPQVPGGYLEPRFHVKTSSDPSKVFSQVIAHLDTFENLDYIVSAKRFKVKAVAYSAGRRTAFVARVFSMDVTSDDHYVVEFQRRSGDLALFSGIYDEVCATLANAGFVSAQTKSDIMCYSQILPPDTDDELEEQQGNEAKQITETLRCLLQMLTAKNVDIQSHAAQEITDMSCQPQFTEALVRTAVKIDVEDDSQDADIETDAVSVLADGVYSSSDEIMRCSLTSLGNLFQAKQEATVAQKLVSINQGELINRLCFLINNKSSKVTAHVVRESSRLLQNVCVSKSYQVLSTALQGKVQATAQYLTTAADARLHKYGSAIGKTM
jgi:hypothetical protein